MFCHPVLAVGIGRTEFNSDAMLRCVLPLSFIEEFTPHVNSQLD